MSYFLDFPLYFFHHLLLISLGHCPLHALVEGSSKVGPQNLSEEKCKVKVMFVDHHHLCNSASVRPFQTSEEKCKVKAMFADHHNQCIVNALFLSGQLLVKIIIMVKVWHIL